MALIKPQLVEYVLRELTPLHRSELGSLARVDDIEALIPRACDRLAHMCMRDLSRRSYLSRIVGFTPVAGVCDISTSTYDDLLFESIPSAELTVNSNPHPLVYVKTWLDLYYPPAGQDNDNLIYFTLDGRRIQTRNVDGSRTSLDEAITATKIVFVPTIHATTAASTTLPVQLEDELIEIMIDLVMASHERPAARRR